MSDTRAWLDEQQAYADAATKGPWTSRATNVPGRRQAPAGDASTTRRCEMREEVRTAEELDALPVGSVVAIFHRDGSGPSVYVRDRDDGWLMATERIVAPTVGEVDADGVRRDMVGNRRAPLTVIYRPEEDA